MKQVKGAVPLAPYYIAQQCCAKQEKNSVIKSDGGVSNERKYIMHPYDSNKKREQKIHLEFDKVADLLSEIIVKYIDKIEVEELKSKEESKEPS